MIWGLLLLAILASSGADRENGRHQVVVVGAGVSGFTAAATLLKHNVTDLVILEASDRIGGRIHTVQFGGVTIDKGAEFVHGEVDNAVFELVSPFDLLTSLSSLVGIENFLLVNTSGYIFNSTCVVGLLHDAYSIMTVKDVHHFNGSMADYYRPRVDEMLRSKNVDTALGDSIARLAELRMNAYTAADDLTKLGVWGHSQYWENVGDLSLKWKTGGYNTLFDFLSKKRPNPSEELPVVNKTLLNKNVTTIEQKENHVEVTCADGSSYLADHVIVTVSLGVLKKHAATMFSPPLPSVNTAAIKNLGFGCISKVFVLFPTRWWPHDINVIIPVLTEQELQDFRANSVHGWWTTNTSAILPVMNHERMLCAWFSGDTSRALDNLSEQQLSDGLKELLDKILGKKFNIPNPEAILRTDWGSNPYTLGTYSFRSVDSDRLNITNDDLAKPILHGDKPVIQIAGEATHPHYFSTVHGALSSGRREAEILVNYLKSQSLS